MDGPDAYGLTRISSVPDRKDTTKGTAVKDTISIGRESTTWEWRFMLHVKKSIRYYNDTRRDLPGMEFFCNGGRYIMSRRKNKGIYH